MGWCFIALGAIAFALPQNYGNLMMGLSFGGLHIIFGAIIAMAGCFQGMQVEGNSEQVGLKTTAAVVQAIFLVIVLDAFFAVFFSSIGWD